MVRPPDRCASLSKGSAVQERNAKIAKYAKKKCDVLDSLSLFHPKFLPVVSDYSLDAVAQ